MGLIPPKNWTPSLADECLPHRERGHDPPLGICMGPIGGGGGQGGSEFLGDPLQNISEAFNRKYKYIFGTLSSRAVEWHPL